MYRGGKKMAFFFVVFTPNLFAPLCTLQYLLCYALNRVCAIVMCHCKILIIATVSWSINQSMNELRIHSFMSSFCMPRLNSILTLLFTFSRSRFLFFFSFNFLFSREIYCPWFDSPETITKLCDASIKKTQKKKNKKSFLNFFLFSSSNKIVDLLL